MKTAMLSHVFGKSLVRATFPDHVKPQRVQQLLKKGRLEAVEKMIGGRLYLVGFRRKGSRDRKDFYPLAIGIPLAKQKTAAEASAADRAFARFTTRKGTGIMYRLKRGEEPKGFDQGEPTFEKMNDGSFEHVSTNETGTTLTVNIAKDSEDAAKLEEIHPEDGAQDDQQAAAEPAKDDTPGTGAKEGDEAQKAADEAPADTEAPKAE